MRLAELRGAKVLACKGLGNWQQAHGESVSEQVVKINDAMAELKELYGDRCAEDQDEPEEFFERLHTKLEEFLND